ncbi:MAG: twin-arginine translocase TatA/TatE family subunit [Ilumatobacteraceae bacterium]
MFNLSGSEIVVILLLALVVLGPEKLPEALRRAGRTYAELKKMGDSFQAEVKSALDEPMKEMRDTADLLRKAASPTEAVKSAVPRIISTTSSPGPKADDAATQDDDEPNDVARPVGPSGAADPAPAPDRAAAGDEPSAMNGDPDEDLINRTLSGGVPATPARASDAGDGGSPTPLDQHP